MKKLFMAGVGIFAAYAIATISYQLGYRYAQLEAEGEV